MCEHVNNPAELINMRRKDRAKDDAWIQEIVTSAGFCSIATVDGHQPFINTVTFVYDSNEHSIYFHTAKQGRLRGNVDRGSRVCATVAEMGRLLPARTARSFSVEFRSVVMFGRISIIEDLDTGTAAMQLFMDKYFPHLKPGDDYRAIQPHEIEEISIYRIDIEAWSGKEKRADDDAQGAFYWGEQEA